MFDNQINIGLTIILLFCIPILLKKYIAALQVCFAIIWIIILVVPEQIGNSFIDNMQLVLPFWCLGSIFAIAVNNGKK